ncbi:GNAT family N-acetyltransferase [uncultured Alsobacter sp.]|uniref:GNAT family N-acetyltransferase n=1 Tax=uncultured Alsobacter sp. TaxID=1748258 RepID=UPI0025F3FBC8|nr:GNAT family N-acetyltransferase [uncultured Alsobacter sp.]
MTAPTLTTDRLVLSAHTPRDWNDCIALWSDPEVVRFIGGKPFAPDEVWARILRYAGLWALVGYGYWAVRDRASGQFLGEVGFADFRRDIVPALGDRPEAGWILSPAAHGKGYAREAMEAALGWITAAGHSRTVCIIAPGNTASLALAERLGYRREGEAMFRGQPTNVLAR